MERKTVKSWNCRQIKTILFLYFILSSPIFALAQSHYQFSALSGTFTPLNLPNNVPVIQVDDAVSAPIALGFTFLYNDVNYNQIVASSNGFISFDTSAGSLNNNDLANSTGRPIIAPLWDNLSGIGGTASWKITGSAPNRIFTFEWLNWKWNNTASASGISFQIKLYETSNRIEFIFRQEAGVLANANASIGLAFQYSGNNNFLSLNNTSASPVASFTAETNGINSKPATGQIYRFDKLAPFNFLTDFGFSGNYLIGEIAWMDYDNDGDLDIVSFDTSNSGDIIYSGKIFINNGDGTFTRQDPVFIDQVRDVFAACGDYNGDGYIDILVAGTDVSNMYVWTFFSRIFKNNGDGSFTHQESVSLTGITKGDANWSDLDNDGDLDLVICGFYNSSGMYSSNSVPITQVYWNKSNNFILSDCKFKGGQLVEVADYNKDSYPDILVSGIDINENSHTTLYANSGTCNFIEQQNIGLPADNVSNFEWGDYENDGDLDLLGSSVFLNNGSGGFSEQTVNNLPANTSTKWGDYDNDGDLDILAGSSIYKNNGSNLFSIINSNANSGKWGDYDKDGDLDIVGKSGVYRNNCQKINEKPQKPTNPLCSLIAGQAILSWDEASDSDTPNTSLFYNIRVGTSPGLGNIVSPMSHPGNGNLKIPFTGNSYQNTQFILQNLPAVTYYWSVQTIDNALLASEFTDEQSFQVKAPFTKAAIQYPTVRGLSGWVDSDNDNDMDVFLSGKNYGVMGVYPTWTFTSQTITAIYNNGITYAGNCGFAEIPYKNYSWADYNNDGLMDVILDNQVYNNNGNNNFTEDINIDLSACINGLGTWGDYDNDGDLDILMTTPNYAVIYTNKGNNSFLAGIDTLKGTFCGAGQWGDYDKDSDYDILFAGSPGKIYKNDGNNNFSELTNIQLKSINDGTISWGDYDNDGDLDIILSGKGAYNVFNIYRNDGNDQFSVIDPEIRKGCRSALLGDYNNDGYPDILISGTSGSEDITRLYSNKRDQTYTEIDLTQAELIKSSVHNVTEKSSIAWGDHNNDNDLDFTITGSQYFDDPRHPYTESYSCIISNNLNYPNSKPSIPENLQTELSGFDILLNWNKAIDPDCTAGNLYYNLRVGTTPGGIEIISPMSGLNDGYRRIPAIGNAQCNTNWILKKLKPGIYYWSVQAIDQSFTGGDWAPDKSFIIPEISADFELNDVCLGNPSIFTDISLSPNEPIISWQWDFGDGVTSTIQNPVHTYEVAGTFLVNLTIHSSNYQHTVAKNVIVKYMPNPDFNIAHKGGMVCQFSNITNVINPGETQWLWNFGDGNASSERFPAMYDYTAEGVYEVSLIVETGNGCKDSVSKVNLVCSSGLEQSEIYVRGPNVWYFAASNDSVSNYRWYRNDELISNANQYIYVANQQLGTYHVEINNGGACWIPSEKVTIPDDFYNGHAKKMAKNTDLQSNESTILVFPNPNKGKFTLLFDNEFTGKLKINIKDLSGKTLRQYYADKTESFYLEDMDLGKYGKGIYFVEMIYKDKSETVKLVLE